MTIPQALFIVTVSVVGAGAVYFLIYALVRFFRYHSDIEWGELAKFAINLSLSQYLHIAANFSPIIGVIYFEWQISTLLTLYFLETIMAGIYNIILLARTRKPDSSAFALLYTFLYGLSLLFLYQAILPTFGFEYSGLSKYLIPLLLYFLSYSISYTADINADDGIHRKSILYSFTSIIGLLVGVSFAFVGFELFKYLEISNPAVIAILVIVIFKIIYDLVFFRLERGSI